MIAARLARLTPERRAEYDRLERLYTAELPPDDAATLLGVFLGLHAPAPRTPTVRAFDRLHGAIMAGSVRGAALAAGEIVAICGRLLAPKRPKTPAPKPSPRPDPNARRHWWLP